MSSSLDGLLELVNLKKGVKTETITLIKHIEEIIHTQKPEIEKK